MHRPSWLCTGEFSYIANDEEDFVFSTTHSAPRKRVVRIPALLQPAAGDPSGWTDLLPQRDTVLEFAAAVAHDYLVAEYMEDVKSKLSVHRLADGVKVRDINIPVGAGQYCGTATFFFF